MVATVRMEESLLAETVTILVDRALDSMRDRTVVSASDVVDLLLDLRSSLMATVEIELEEAAARARTAPGTSARRGARPRAGPRPAVSAAGRATCSPASATTDATALTVATALGARERTAGRPAVLSSLLCQCCCGATS